MPITFSAKPERIEDFEYELRATGMRAEHLFPVMDEIVDKILERNQRAFDTRGASTGRYWAPLKKATIERKQRLGVSDPFAPLRRTDKLMASLSERHAEHQILEVEDDGFYLSTDLPYAPIHASGDGDRMPARPPLVVPKSHVDEYMKMIKDYVIFGETDA